LITSGLSSSKGAVVASFRSQCSKLLMKEVLMEGCADMSAPRALAALKSGPIALSSHMALSRLLEANLS